MPRGWMVSLGLALSVCALAAAVGATQRQERTQPQDDASADPCFRYGRFECCVRPDAG